MTDDNTTDGTDHPTSAADPRPNDEPYYIESTCPDCGTRLVLNDEHRPTGDGSGERVAPEVWDEREVVWHDEWVCPECENGIHMDWPDCSLHTDTDRRDDQP